MIVLEIPEPFSDIPENFYKSFRKNGKFRFRGILKGWTYLIFVSLFFISIENFSMNSLFPMLVITSARVFGCR